MWPTSPLSVVFRSVCLCNYCILFVDRGVSCKQYQGQIRYFQAKACTRGTFSTPQRFCFASMFALLLHYIFSTMKHIETHSQMTLFFIWCGMDARRCTDIQSKHPGHNSGHWLFSPEPCKYSHCAWGEEGRKNYSSATQPPIKATLQTSCKISRTLPKRNTKSSKQLALLGCKLAFTVMPEQSVMSYCLFFLLCSCFLPTTFKPAQTRSVVKKGNMVDNFWFTYVGTIISVSEESRKSRSRTLEEARVGCIDETFWVWLSREIQSQGISLYFPESYLPSKSGRSMTLEDWWENDF